MGTFWEINGLKMLEELLRSKAVSIWTGPQPEWAKVGDQAWDIMEEDGREYVRSIPPDSLRDAILGRVAWGRTSRPYSEVFIDTEIENVGTEYTVEYNFHLRVIIDRIIVFVTDTGGDEFNGEDATNNLIRLLAWLDEDNQTNNEREE